EKIFKSHENHLYFLDKYTQHTSSICDTWAYCLLPNHFHLLIRVKPMHQIVEHYKLIKTKDLPEHDELQLSDFIMERVSNWLNGYTKAFNKMSGRRGSLFIDYTKRSLVETDVSFAKLVHYIHANPVHHGYVKQIYDWHYSS